MTFWSASSSWTLQGRSFSANSWAGGGSGRAVVALPDTNCCSSKLYWGQGKKRNMGWRNPQGQAQPALRLPQRGLPPPCEAPPWLLSKSRKQMAQCRQDRPKQQPRWLRRFREPSRSHAPRPGLMVSSRNTAPGEHNMAAAPQGMAAPHVMTTIMRLATEKNGGMSSAHVK